KSPTDNSILGRNAFQLRSSSGGVTRTCEIQRTRLEDGQIFDVIDTLEFDFNVESGLVVNEIGKYIDLADDGVHTVLFILFVRTSFSKDEQATIHYFKKLFGTKISDYMIVVYTRGDKLEDNDSLNDQLDCSCREDLKEVLKMCGDLKQGIANELKEQVQRFSFKEQYRRITEMAESKMNNTMHSLERQLEEECTARLLTYTMWIAKRYWVGSMNKLLSHRRSTRKGNLYSSYAKLLT
ncbi:hypothetical protein H5410_002907, partial [Solanum commersonii]